jgi:Flp pilus assembly protein CpaB
MKSRGLVVGIAVVLAAAAAAFVLLYTNGVKQEAASGGALSTVIVATQDIPANTNLNPLVDQGAFAELQVPTDAVVDGAVTDTSQLRGLTTTLPILANEQIPASRLSTGKSPLGGSLGITNGHVAVSLQVDNQAGVNGSVTRGSYVTVYATFDNVKLVPGGNPQQQIQGAIKGASSAQQSAQLPPLTVTLVPAVRVLDVVNPVIDENGTSGSSDVTLTLDLTAEDAQNLVYAQHTGTTWIGLLPPNDTDGHSIPFSVIPLDRLLGKAG